MALKATSGRPIVLYMSYERLEVSIVEYKYEPCQLPNVKMCCHAPDAGPSASVAKERTRPTKQLRCFLGC